MQRAPFLALGLAMSVAVATGCTSTTSPGGSDGGGGGGGGSSTSSSSGGASSSSGAASSSSSSSSSGGSTSSSSGSSSGGIDASVPSTVVLIDFDELADETTVTTQYAPHATFSSATGTVEAFDPLSLGQSPPNFICSDSGECDADYTIAFGAGVTGLAFDAIGVNDTGTVASIAIYEGGTLGPTIPLTGQGNEGVPVHVDLSTYTNVTRVDVTNITDLAGFGLDNVTFAYPE